MFLLSFGGKYSYIPLDFTKMLLTFTPRIKFFLFKKVNKNIFFLKKSMNWKEKFLLIFFLHNLNNFSFKKTLTI